VLIHLAETGAISHDNAADVEANTTMSPSPRFFDSEPPDAASA
jgi:hypothetical protein